MDRHVDALAVEIEDADTGCEIDGDLRMPGDEFRNARHQPAGAEGRQDGEVEHAAGAEFARAPRWLRCLGTWGTVAGLVSLAFETVAGSTLHCSTTAPVTYDIAGYSDTDITWTALGEITDLGQGYGRTYNIVTHAPIDTAQVIEKKGGYKLGTVELLMAWDQSDAGQDLLRTASADNSILTFKLTKQGGDIRYFTAQVSKFVENFGTVDNVVVGAVTLLLQKNVVHSPA